MIRYLLLMLLLGYLPSFAQKKDSLKTVPLHATANIQLTNNGVSLFPNLSLGKPATIINLTLAKNKFSFEPELRWGLNGKPWSYIFWVRYRYAVNKLSLRAGVHPSYVFGQQEVQINNKTDKRFIATRYAAGEIAPTYKFGSQFQLGVHYLHAIGLDNYGVQESNFYSFQPRFVNLGVGKNLYFDFFPQLFYLQLDDKAGTYVSETLNFSKKNFPVYLSNVMTYKLKSTIAGDAFVWSLGLNIKL